MRSPVSFPLTSSPTPHLQLLDIVAAGGQNVRMQFSDSAWLDHDDLVSLHLSDQVTLVVSQSRATTMVCRTRLFPGRLTYSVFLYAGCFLMWTWPCALFWLRWYWCLLLCFLGYQLVKAVHKSCAQEVYTRVLMDRVFYLHAQQVPGLLHLSFPLTPPVHTFVPPPAAAPPAPYPAPPTTLENARKNPPSS